jgi:hypothetical protein
MRISRPQLLGGVLIGLLLLIGLWAFASRTEAPALTPEQTGVTASSTKVRGPVEPAPVLVRSTDEERIALKSASVPATAMLVVEGTSYSLTSPEGTLLKEAMDTLQAQGGFSYQFKEYAGLGAFVTHINGRAGTGKQAWILYVNGKKSGTGISQTRIRSADIIEWKLEATY